MMARRSEAAASPADFDALEIGRLTWMGLVVASLGWALLIGEATVADILPAHDGRLPPSFHSDLLDIAKCVIGSGFALAIVGALQSGFGTLNRFFSAVLTRSTQRTAPSSAPSVVDAAPAPKERRPYRTLGDGSVEVDTILGTRRFSTMREAREFI